jgi:zinc protease
MSRFAIFACIALSLVTDSSARAADTKTQTDAELVKTAQGILKDLRETTLENGLRVYLLPMKHASVVSVMVAYRVGSGDEEKDQTGLSHYLEHLMFKGTEKLLPGDIDRITQRNGGQNNAYTSEDMTVYHFDFAANRWQAALEIEADRMRNLRIDKKHEFEEEKGNVISELNHNEDSPYDLESKTILPLLFPKDSPYSHPVIGVTEHVRGATAEIIKKHYDKWYHPNNASLVIVGEFDAEEALTRIKKLFGPIPKAELPPRKPATFFKDRAGPVHKEFESKFDTARMLMGFNTVAVGTPDDPLLDVVQDLLADGRTSRLYTKLVEVERIASSVNVSNNSGRYPGWFSISLDLLKGKDRKKVEELVFAELDKLATEPVSDGELNRARRKILASRVFGRESVHGLANAIAQTSALPVGEDVAKFFKDYQDGVLAVTKEDIKRAAKQYLSRKQAVVVWSVPKEDKPGAGPADPPGKKPNRAPQLRSYSRSSNAAAEGVGLGGFDLKAAKRVVLPNGLTVIMLEDHRLPMVVAEAEVTDVFLREPVEKSGLASLTGSLLDEGTDKHTSKQIATLIEDTGGTLAMNSTGGSLKVLTPDIDLGLELLFESLTHPTFPAEAFDRHKEQQLSSIDDAQTQPEIRASDLFHALVYGKHPFGRPSYGTRATVEKLTRADCQTFHKTAFAPNFTIVVLVGDFKIAELSKKIEDLTKDWKKSDLGKPDVPAPPRPTEATTKIVSDPNAAEVHFYVGQLGITRNNPDYYKLLVMDYVLGTGTGFTDRLSAKLRDRQGLAYTVRAAITTSAGTQPGVFEGYANPSPNDYLKLRFGFLAEIRLIREKPATKDEVEDAKQYLLGSLPFRFTMRSTVASQLLAAERFGLGFDFLEKYEKEVAAVTPDDVLKVAEKYLDPKTLTIVAVGAIDQDGKPLAKKK